jgi:hypothetical protein
MTGLWGHSSSTTPCQSSAPTQATTTTTLQNSTPPNGLTAATSSYTPSRVPHGAPRPVQRVTAELPPENRRHTNAPNAAPASHHAVRGVADELGPHRARL